jgi:hypothetical protein
MINSYLKRKVWDANDLPCVDDISGGRSAVSPILSTVALEAHRARLIPDPGAERGGVAPSFSATSRRKAITREGERIMDRLWALYEHWCMEELISLREFILRVKAGEFGPFSRDEVIALLREIEANILANIELKAMEDPELEALKEERMAETNQEIEALVAEWDRS